MEVGGWDKRSWVMASLGREVVEGERKAVGVRTWDVRGKPLELEVRDGRRPRP